VQEKVHDAEPSDRRALASVGLQFWMNGVVFASFIPRLPEIRTRLGIEVDELGVLLTVGVIGGLAASGVCGRVIDRFGSKGVMTAASFGVVAIIPLLGLARTPVAFALALVVLQFLDVLIDVPMNLQASWLSAGRQVPVINRLHGLWSVGNVTGGVAATIAASRLPLEVHLLAVSAVLLVALGYIVPGLIDDDSRYTAATGGGGGPGVGPVETSTTEQRRRPRLLATFALLGALAIMAEVVPADWAAIRLVDDLGVDPGSAGLGFVAFTLGMVAGRFGGDAASSRFGQLRSWRWAIALSGVGLAIATLSTSPAVSIAGFLIAGTGTALVFPGLYDRAARTPGRPGEVLGAMTAGIRVGLLAVPITVGTLAAGPMTVGHAMLSVGLVAAVGLWLLSWTGERP